MYSVQYNAFFNQSLPRCVVNKMSIFTLRIQLINVLFNTHLTKGVNSCANICV